jgi:hypothetical protein
MHHGGAALGENQTASTEHPEDGGVTFLQNVSKLGEFLSDYTVSHPRKHYSCMIVGSHSGGYEEYYLLGYNAV